MGHRLSFHNGKCRNLHGHTYKMILTLEGKLIDDRMLIDFYDLDKIMKPFLEELDHSVICHSDDKELINLLTQLNTRIYLFPKETTVENMVIYFSELIMDKMKEKINTENFVSFTLKIFETDDAAAEITRRFN